jgi:hypothetical protein
MREVEEILHQGQVSGEELEVVLHHFWLTIQHDIATIIKKIIFKGKTTTSCFSNCWRDATTTTIHNVVCTRGMFEENTWEQFFLNYTTMYQMTNLKSNVWWGAKENLWGRRWFCLAKD